MITNIEFVSQVSGILKSNNKDNKLPKRMILGIGKDVAKNLISQKLLDRTITQETNLYSLIECFEFEQIEAKRCPSIEFRLCSVLMKSMKPLPELIFSRLGASIKDVVALDGNFVFSFVDEAQYRRNKKRSQTLKNQIFIYLGTDNHLYIPDREIYSLDLTVLTLDNISNPSNCIETDDCENLWYKEFICPDKLLETVKDITLQRLMVTKQIREDNNPNGLEGA